MKVSLIILSLALTLNCLLPPLKTDCRSEEECKQKKQDFIATLGPKDFRTLVYLNFQKSKDYDINDYAKTGNENNYNLNDKAFEYLEDFRDDTDLIQDVILSYTPDIQFDRHLINLGDMLRDPDTDLFKFQSVADIIDNFVYNKIIKLGYYKDGPFGRPRKKINKCGSQCMMAMENIYKLYLSITQELNEDHEKIFEEQTDLYECIGQRKQLKLLYKDALANEIKPIRNALYRFANLSFARYMCENTEM